MKIIAIILIISSIYKILQSLSTNDFKNLTKDINIPDIIDMDVLENLIKFVIGMDGMIGLLCGLFILHVL